LKVRSAEIVASCAQVAQLPAPDLPEVAFLGRSNVGKSSLLNKLVGRKQLARTSSTPGKTRLIHFFRAAIGSRELLLVDLPGYGFARVSRKERDSWQRLIEGYLGDRPPLRLAILLQDLRRDVSDDETLLLEWLAGRGVPTLVALTKCDKLPQMRRAKRVREHRSALDGTRVLATSATRGFGMDELWKAIHAATEAPPAVELEDR